jgi:uncharacterized protein with LGFP repeats
VQYRAARLGYVLGAPTSDEMDAWLPGARVQTFQGGQMLWSRATGAHEVYGSIGSRYRSQLAELSPLGLPTSGERAGPLPASRMNTFQRGAIYWSLASGAHEVYGAIYGKYISLTTADRARLGLPVTGEYSVAGGRQSRFQGGTITWSASSRSTVVRFT